MYSTQCNLGKYSNNENLSINDAELAKFFSLRGTAGPIEIRIIGAVKKSWRGGMPVTLSGYFDWPDAAIAQLKQAANDYDFEAVYASINRLPVDLMARAANVLIAKPKSTTSDGEVIGRDWLAIDLDPCRPSGVSANDVEHLAAHDRALIVRDHLTALGWPDPVIADSGNGFHLLYRLDGLPMTDEITTAVAGVYEYLDGKFSDSTVKVDRTLFNPSRILKIYGTPVRKGFEIAGRRHRQARMIDVPAEMQFVTLDQITALVPTPTNTVDDDGVEYDRAITIDGWLEKFIERHNIETTGPEPYKGGLLWHVPTCPFCGESDGSAVIRRSSEGRIGFKCHHNRCAGKGWAIFRSHFENYPDPRAETIEVDDPKPAAKIGPTPSIVERIAAMPTVVPQKRKFERPKRRSWRDDEVDQWPAVEWLVDRHIPVGSFAQIFGEYGSCKSFYVLELCLCIATGRPFLGKYPVKQGPTVYVAGEGKAGLQKRIAAWKFKHGVKSIPNFRVIDSAFNLCDEEEVEELLDIIMTDFPEGVALTAIDTLARNFGGNENDGNDMASFIDSAAAIQAVARSAVAVVHHAGKDAAKKSRGHSSFPGANDTIIEIKKTADGLDVRCEKQKDEEEFADYFASKTVIDAGNGRSSLVLEFAGTKKELQAAIPDRVLEAIPYTPDTMTYQSLAEALGENLEAEAARTKYRSAVERLEKAGKVVTVGAGTQGRGKAKTFSRT